MTFPLHLNKIDVSWKPILEKAIQTVDKNYLHQLKNEKNWLPGKDNIFNAFSLPLHQTHYILFGESPYPRIESANGYAFWDAATHSIWSEKGLDKKVNRATSLRNFIKMLLVCEGYLHHEDLSQHAILNLPKESLIQTTSELFKNMLKEGFLLLNTSLVLSTRKVNLEAHYWHPFIESILSQLHKTQPHIKLILFGKIAEKIISLPSSRLFEHFKAPHPYNLPFITYPSVLHFFKPFHLLNYSINFT